MVIELKLNRYNNMATETKNVAESKDLTVEERLRALYKLQQVISQIDKLRNVRGELPLEVKDLEDEVAGLETRIERCAADITDYNQEIASNKIKINEARELIAKKEDQRMNVANNREYDALTKELEFQQLEIELAEKKIRDATGKIEVRSGEIDEAKAAVVERKQDLARKKEELKEIVDETRQEEEKLMKQAKALELQIDEYYLAAFKKLRKNARNGLAVVTVDRDACGGCFHKIPPQRQLDIKMRKKVIVCENCGRILVDDKILEEN